MASDSCILRRSVRAMAAFRGPGGTARPQAAGSLSSAADGTARLVLPAPGTQRRTRPGGLNAACPQLHQRRPTGQVQLIRRVRTCRGRRPGETPALRAVALSSSTTAATTRLNCGYPFLQSPDEASRGRSRIEGAATTVHHSRHDRAFGRAPSGRASVAGGW
jgi:hypothetical protein